MGYIIVLVLGVALLVVLMVVFMGGKKRPVGRVARGDDLTPKEPAADDLTPGASATAGNRAAEAARNHTPPA